jgi:hypothetical protein
VERYGAEEVSDQMQEGENSGRGGSALCEVSEPRPGAPVGDRDRGPQRQKSERRPCPDLGIARRHEGRIEHRIDTQGQREDVLDEPDEPEQRHRHRETRPENTEQPRVARQLEDKQGCSGEDERHRNHGVHGGKAGS